MMLLDDFMQEHCMHAPFKYSCVHHAYPCTYIHAHTMRIMQGFLHSLFEHKWHTFGRYMYWTLRLLDALLLAAIMHLAFELKHAPATCDRRARAGTVLLSNPDPEPNPSPDPSPTALALYPNQAPRCSPFCPSFFSTPYFSSTTCATIGRGHAAPRSPPSSPSSAPGR